MSKIIMQKTAEELSIAEAFEQFKRFKRIQNVSPLTIGFYDDCLSYFGKYFDLQNYCNMIDENVYMGYVEFLQNKAPKIKDITINSYLRGVRTFLKFCMERGYVFQFPVKLMKVDKEIKETYTDDEIKILLKKPDIKTCSFTEYRSWVMINFLLGVGVRLSSMTNVKIKDLDIRNAVVVIRKSKNRKQQIIPTSETLCKVLSEYLEYRGGEAEDYLFPTQFGGQLKTRGVESAIATYNRKRGVEKTSVHVFRHTFAKMWIMNGGDIFSLQKILGHSSLDVVKEYVNLYGRELQQQYNRFNPLENFAQTNVNRKTIGMNKKEREI